MHLTDRLFLKFGVANRQHFVHNQDLRLKMRRNRKSQAHIHAAAVALDWCVEKTLDLGESDDLVEFRFDLRPRHAEDRPVEENILATSQLGVKTGADFEQARDPTTQSHAS